MSISTLITAVSHLAHTTHTFTETDLNNESWAWQAYEGNRYALLQTQLELRQLAADLAHKRAQSERPISAAQRILAQHRAAYRDFQSLFIGIGDAVIDDEPQPHEWPIRTILIHVYYVERNFYATILNGMQNRTGDEAPPPLAKREDAVLLLNDADDLPPHTGPLADIWAAYEKLHQRIAHELGQFSDEQLQLTSRMWEPTAYANTFRMHRFHTHLREHTNQMSKTLVWLDRAPNEAKLLLRQIYEALAQVEGALLGAEDLGTDECSALAEEIAARTEAVATAVAQTHDFLDAVKTGDLTTIEALLAANPALANTIGDDGIAAVVTAAYHRHQDIVAALLAAGVNLDLHQAAVVGNLDTVKAELTDYPEDLDIYSRDGFTPLLLACYFGHAEMAQYLLDIGADVQAVSHNPMGIQAIHAAAANSNMTILQALLEKGANANAKQASGNTALDQAIQSKNQAMIALLRQHGATV
jgi:hypothetical protein